MSPQDISDPTIREPVQENAENLRADGHAIFEMVYIARNGRRIPVEVRSHLFEYQQKTLVLGQARDISRRKEAEAAIHESEARVKSIIRVAPIGIGLVAGRTFREVNERLCTMTGYTSGELIGQSVHMLYSTNAEFDRVGTELYSQMRREVTGSIETRWRRKNGESVDILLNSTPLDPHNPYAGDIFTALDITRRKLGEQAARAGEERYRQLIERSFNAVVVLEQGVIRIANDAACTIIGVQSPGQLNGQPLLAFIHPDFHDFVTSQLAELLAAPGSAMPLMRLTGRRLNGGDVEIDVMAASFLEDGVPAVQAVFREVSGSR